MISIYTAGYMAGPGSDRLDWRAELVSAVAFGGTHIGYDGVEWLHPGVPEGAIPGQGDPSIYMARDLAQINRADAIVALFDLGLARCIGVSCEIGIAFQQRKPIIMIDLSPDIGSLDFARVIATSVWEDVESAAIAVRFLALGLPGRETNA